MQTIIGKQNPKQADIIKDLYKRLGRNKANKECVHRHIDRAKMREYLNW